MNVFNNFNLKLKNQTSLGIVGSTGSGKSTLIKLLQRFYDPSEGEVLLDEINLKEYDLNSLRSAISVVSQDVYLFHGTILENLKFAKPDASDMKIFKACEQACIHDFIQSLPDQYMTLVGERGQKLSGGQKQRVSIARMLLANSPIIILDEATSAVDNIMEAKLQLKLNHVLQNKTLIVIAHRLSTVINCDQVVVLENGQIIESGTHEELLQNKKVYQELWDIQTGKK
jgi:ATP-binding cassette subfamily B protein